MRYLSVCSGIEAATVAWHPLGWQPVAFSEIEKFPSQVLAHHYPDVPNLGDMTKFQEWTNVTDIDVFVGGTPCQSFSVAGLRKGLADPRGNLMLTYLAIAERYQPKWLVWENVPGVLSSNGGRDFGTFLGALGQLGYGFAYRVLDAQYFGVAQRRRRVFVVGYLGDWRRAAAVLFESESMSGHPAPSRKERQNIATTITGNLGTGGPNDMTPIVIGNVQNGEVTTLSSREYKGLSCGRDGLTSAAVIQTYGIPGNWIGRNPKNGGNAIQPMYDVAPCLTKTDRHGVAQPIAYSFDSLNSNSMKSKNPISGCSEVEVSKTLDTSRGLDPSCNQGGIGIAQPIAFSTKQQSMNCSDNVANSLAANDYKEPQAIIQQMAVRRLTPVECERLQGFPDGYTDIKENTPDGPRYKALGNSMAVPVMRWIGKQIQMVEKL
jgi:DNA (cytosine-5)-methyltransferase 1